MRYYKEVTLSDGTNCILRNPIGTDAREVLDLLKKTSEETDQLLRYPDEIHMTVEEERQFLENMASQPNTVMILAVVNDQIIANAGLTPVSECDKCRHRASFGIAMLKNYWGRGIGTQLMVALLESAQEMGYRQIELEVLSDNDRALSLYKKFEFKIYGTNEKAFYFRDGTYQASHLMSRSI